MRARVRVHQASWGLELGPGELPQGAWHSTSYGSRGIKEPQLWQTGWKWFYESLILTEPRARRGFREESTQADSVSAPTGGCSLKLHIQLRDGEVLRECVSEGPRSASLRPGAVREHIWSAAFSALTWFNSYMWRLSNQFKYSPFRPSHLCYSLLHWNFHSHLLNLQMVDNYLLRTFMSRAFPGEFTAAETLIGWFSSEIWPF